MSSQLQIHGVQLVDTQQEAFQGKTGWYAKVGHGEEVPLHVEELCGHSHETIATKGAWISATTMTIWHHFHSSNEPETPKSGPSLASVTE